MVGKTQAEDAANAAQLAVHRYVMPVRWGDLDMLQHVNNTVFFRFFEEARMRFLIQAQPGVAPGKPMVLAHTACDFLAPLRYPATAVVKQKLARIGRSSLVFNAVIEREDEPGVPCARAVYTVVGVDPVTQRSAAWTETELAALTSLQHTAAGSA